jgi:curved DNA-binding protein CbpA
MVSHLAIRHIRIDGAEAMATWISSFLPQFSQGQAGNPQRNKNCANFRRQNLSQFLFVMSNGNIRDYYYILGIANNASGDEIRTAYRKLSMKFHPDQNSGDKFFEERFKDIQEAYETLSDDLKRKLYDEQFKATSNTTSSKNTYAGSSQNFQQAAKAGSPVSPVPRKNKLKQTFYGLLALVLFSSPAWLPPLVHELYKQEKSAVKKNNTTDTLKADAPDDKVTLLRVIYDSADTSPHADTTYTNQEPAVPEKDDDNLTSTDVIKRFFDALSHKDCHGAWNLTYNAYWVTQGEDWFCSSNAFGGVTGLMVYEIMPIEITNSHSSFFAEYYAEDIYNGNKCFKQTIFLQKIGYTDGRWRWRMTKMRNNETPAACDGF